MFVRNFNPDRKTATDGSFCSFKFQPGGLAMSFGGFYQAGDHALASHKIPAKVRLIATDGPTAMLLGRVAQALCARGYDAACRLYPQGPDSWLAASLLGSHVVIFGKPAGDGNIDAARLQEKVVEYTSKRVPMLCPGPDETEENLLKTIMAIINKEY